MSILEEITRHKRANLPTLKTELSFDALTELKAKHPPRRGFVDQLNRYSPAVIAEIKKASPSKGVIRQDFDPVRLAHSYAQNHAACISILTDTKYFQGSDTHLTSVRGTVNCPLLRKDFVIDASQVIESLELGADCVLLIVAALSPLDLRTLYDVSCQLGLEVLIEVHDQKELELALSCEPHMIGINNRNLRTFETSLDTTFKLVSEVPNGIRIVSESGIHTPSQVQELRSAGVDTFLVGEAFMRQPNPGQALSDLFGPIVIAD